MDEPQAFLNGRWTAASQAVAPVWDAGFVLGTTVAEQLRTFGGRLFRLEQHLARLRHSLEIVGVEPGFSNAELAEIANELAERNHRLLDPGDDLGLSILVTPGNYAAFAPAGVGEPMVCMHTYPLPFRFFAKSYEQGEAAVITAVQQVSPRCWPPELKCRSRMHYYLADREARRVDPGARALLVDAEGFVCEAPTANVVAVIDGVLVSPPRESILPGISMGVVEQLAAALGIGFTQRRLRPDDLAAAEELLLTSTSPCILPVVRLNGEPIADGRPGATYRAILSAWSDQVGLDIAAQAVRFAHRT